jgi:hypothetical protein
MCVIRLASRACIFPKESNKSSFAVRLSGGEYIRGAAERTLLSQKGAGHVDMSLSWGRARLIYMLRSVWAFT